MIERIVKDTLTCVEERQRTRPLEEIKASLRKSDRRFSRSLRKNRTTLILECKKASPSHGNIRTNFDLGEILAAYDPFTDAISIITNKSFFQGELSFLSEARLKTDKPLLCKDFILTAYQVYEARHFGADAILLMMSLLSNSQYREFSDIASSLGMDVLTETHDQEELSRALDLGAEIIGVNNRDFRTLQVDLSVAQRLLPLIPENKIRVFESGISTHDEIVQFRKLADSFLIGTSLMKSANLQRSVRELVFGRVKVCGLMREEDIKLAWNAGARFGGFIFASESPRCVSLQKARELREGSPLDFVGVFVNETIEKVVECATLLKLHAVQLHGEEDNAYLASLRQKLPQGCEIWKAVRVKTRIPSLQEYCCDRILLDTFAQNLRGGTGQTFDWSLLNDVKEQDKYILSGGLSPKNCKEAQEFGLYALDVNSGIEILKGQKDRGLMCTFFEELR